MIKEIRYQERESGTAATHALKCGFRGARFLFFNSLQEARGRHEASVVFRCGFCGT